MIMQLIMPRLDPLMEEGRVVEWLKNEGEAVKKGETLAVVEGEKTTFEIESPESGVLEKILKKPGEVAKVGEAIAVIKTEEPTEVEKTEREEVILASPAAKKLAREHGINLKEVKGTGPAGRITREDVLRVVEARRLEPPKAKQLPFAGIRKAITERLNPGFHEALPVALMTEFNAENLLEHKRLSRASFTAYAVKASAKALSENPDLNITLENNVITYHQSVNVAVAVDTPKGLMAPVVKDAQSKTLEEITKLIDDFQRRGAGGEITLQEQRGHTFTVSNLGGFDVTFFTPVINPPAAFILALGKIEKKPIASDDNTIQVRALGYLTLVFDHRLVDGVAASKLLKRVKQLLERPEELES